jgi:hypothetical protein
VQQSRTDAIGLRMAFVNAGGFELEQKLTEHDERIVNAFCEYIRDAPDGVPFQLYHLQGALRFANPGIPSQQPYSLYLRVAVESFLLEKVSGEADTYLPFDLYKKKPRRVAMRREQLSILKEKLICELTGREYDH